MCFVILNTRVTLPGSMSLSWAHLANSFRVCKLSACRSELRGDWRAAGPSCLALRGRRCAADTCGAAQPGAPGASTRRCRPYLHFFLRHRDDAVLAADGYAGHARLAHRLERILCGLGRGRLHAQRLRRGAGPFAACGCAGRAAGGRTAFLANHASGMRHETHRLETGGPRAKRL